MAPVLAFLDDTEAECERLITQARREAEQIVASARSEWDLRVLANVDELLRSIAGWPAVAPVRAHMLRGAEAEAGRILAEAREQAGSILGQARRGAAETVDRARAEADAARLRLAGRPATGRDVRRQPAGSAVLESDRPWRYRDAQPQGPPAGRTPGAVRPSARLRP